MSACVAFGVLSAAIGPATALPPGAQEATPVAHSSAYPNRHAVVVAPGVASSVGSGQADADAYAKRLQELGFRVTTIGPSRRFDADAAIRDLARNIAPGSDVALFVPGVVHASDGDIYVLPEDGSSATISNVAALPTDALSLGLLIRSIKRAQPKTFVGVVDECRRVGDPNAACSLDDVAGSSGAGMIAGARFDPSASGRSVVRTAMTRLMTQEGLSFSALYDRMNEAVSPRDAAIVRTRDLSTTFMFTPPRLFETMQTPCNDNTSGELSLDDARRRLSACTTAATLTWPYVPHFQTAREFAEEQLAFARTGVACGPAFDAAAQAYRSRYPSGAFIGALGQRAANCVVQPARRTSFASQTGWTYSYDGDLLYVSPDGDDRNEFPKTQVSTTFHSRSLGTSIVVYVQVLANVECLTPEAYLRFGKVGKRTQRVDYSAAIQNAPLGYYGWALSGRGVKLPGQPAKNLRTLDMVITRIGDRNQFLHIGARIPGEQPADPYVDEVMKIFRSATPPSEDRYRVPCVG